MPEHEPVVSANRPVTIETPGVNATVIESREPSPESSCAGARVRDEVFTRLRLEGRWRDIEPVRDEMMREARKSGLSKEDCWAWVYTELNRLYPPIEPIGTVRDTQCQPAAQTVASETGRVQGLSDIPAEWGQLPDNASLAAEIGWVQAQRLRIVEDKPTGATVVHLDRAGSPAPSWAALGWLETSIRSYAKYVDVVAKSLSQADDEQAHVKRERMRIDEIKQLLDEMHSTG